MVNRLTLDVEMQYSLTHTKHSPTLCVFVSICKAKGLEGHITHQRCDSLWRGKLDWGVSGAVEDGYDL